MELYFVIACTLGIVVAIIVPPIWLFRNNPSPRTQYRIVVMLVLFALSAIMALLFGVTGEVTANVPVAVKVGGPFAAFLAALIITLYFFDYKPDEIGSDRNILNQVSEAIQAVEKKFNWVSYENVKENLDGFREINGPEEEHFIRNLLGAAYSPNDGVKDITKVKIDTAFLYLSDSVVKLQRIRGTTIRRPSFIRFRSNSSYGAKGVMSVILVSSGKGSLKVGDAFSEHDSDEQMASGYARITYENFDCLILTLYPEYPEYEDYLLVDVPRFSGENTADISLSIVSTQKNFQDLEVWNMRRPLICTEERFPINFRRMNSVNSRGREKIKDEFIQWFQILDKYESTTRKEDVKKILATIHNRLNDSVQEPDSESDMMTFSNAFDSITNFNAFQFQVSQISNTVLALFTWEKK